MPLPLSALLMVMTSVANGGSSMSQAVRQESITGAALVELIAAADSGKSDVDRTHLTITGPVDLRPLRRVDRPLRCLECTFEGPVIASDVVFSSVIELVGTTFRDDVNAHGATFEEGVVLDRAHFARKLDFTGAQFSSMASFDRTDVDGPAIFDRALFSDRAVFTASPADKERPGSCRSTNGRFDGKVSFRGALFSDDVLFRQRCFGQNTSFETATFGARADFTLTSYMHEASFTRSAFEGEASFVVANFIGPAAFSGLSIAGLADFNDSVVRSDLDFGSSSGPGRLDLRGLRDDAEQAHPLGLSGLTLSGLTMDLQLVKSVRGPDAQIDVLALIERTARHDGDGGVANDAHFELLVHQNRRLPLPQRLIDSVFYGGIAGYLVKPLHPIGALVVVAMVGTFVRAMPTLRRALRRRPHRLTHIAREALEGLAQGAHDTISESWSIHRPAAGPAPPVSITHPVAWHGPHTADVARWTEWLVVKVLIAVSLLGIANASPTIRQLIDAIF